MGKGSENTLVDCATTTTTTSALSSQFDKLTVYTWSEVRKHNKKSDCWIVVNHMVYDVTKFQTRHPGGNRILNFYGGHDATVSIISQYRYLSEISNDQ